MPSRMLQDPHKQNEGHIELFHSIVMTRPIAVNDGYTESYDCHFLQAMIIPIMNG